MRLNRLKVIIGITLLLLTPIAWYLISPLFITRTVDEEFPVVVAAAPAQEVAATSMPASVSGPTSAPTTQATATSTALMPATPAATSTTAPLPSPTDAPAPTMMPTMVPEPTPEPTAIPVPTALPEPAIVLSGAFHPVTHNGTGNATIYRLADGRLFLRFEQFEVLNGPDLYVWLSGAADANSAQEIVDGGYLEVGQLKGNRGNQNYELPADIDISQYRSVTIWCRRFRVNFATAPLR